MCAYTRGIMSDIQTLFPDAPTLADHEIRLREKFISQYVLDFDQYQAALRIGYQSTTALQMAQTFMQCGYVSARLEEERARLGICTEIEIHRHRIVSGLYRVANSKKVTASAQVSAFAQLSKILGLEAPAKTIVDQHVHSDTLTFNVVDSREPQEVVQAPDAG
jgi:hypothetical protein